MADAPEPPRDFGGIYQATIAPLRRYLTRLLGNASDAQDIAHDAYVRVFARPSPSTPQQPEAVLYTTARRLAINRLKRRGLVPFLPETAAADAASAAPDAAEQTMTRQDLELLRAAIEQLPRGCRTVLLLRKVELLSHREIADRLGIAISTVEKQHLRALRLLRAALEPARADGESRAGSQPRVSS